MEITSGDRDRAERGQVLAAVPLEYARETLGRVINLRKAGETYEYEPEFRGILTIAAKILRLEPLEDIPFADREEFLELYRGLQVQVGEVISGNDENKFLSRYTANVLNSAGKGESAQLSQNQLEIAKQFLELVTTE